MIISHDYKFIFIKTRKTAGSSIERFLLDSLKGTNYIFGGMPPENMPPENIEIECEHFGRKFIAERFPDEWESYYKFAVERNPWDKTVSQYYWLKKQKPKKVKNGFEHCIKHLPKVWQLDDWYLYAAKGHIVVDDIIEYNDLHPSFEKTCNKIGLPYNGELNSIKLKANLRSTKDYRSMYDSETIDLVQQYYADVINHFNYKF